MDTSRSGSVKMRAQPDLENVTYTVGRGRKFLGSSAKLKTYVSGVSVTQHSYTLEDELKQLYSGILAVGTHELLFNQPSQVASVSGATLVSHNANRCIVTVSAEGEVVITGYLYADNTSIAVVKDSAILAGEKENILEVTDATLVSNGMEAAQRLFNYYQNRIRQEVTLVLNGEMPGAPVSVEVAADNWREGVIESVETDLTGGFVARVVLVSE